MRESAPSRTRRSRDEAAEVGVGTLIVFIAMVLVAAVAAAVIIGTSGSLEQRAQQTGKEATAEVSSNVKVIDIFGVRADTSHDVSTLRFELELSAGSKDVDLNTMIIRYSDGQTVSMYSLSGSPGYNLSWVRGVNTNNVMKSGDLVDLDLATPAELAPRSHIQITLIPEVGSPIDLMVVTPPTYGTNTNVLIQ
ncbi:MAG: archaeal flagellin FlaB [Thermoplasmata archaeon]|jgi:flagellin FlaB|nr:archaeal flagellin FlaB [Thermoplasmata archaeon]